MMGRGSEPGEDPQDVQGFYSWLIDCQANSLELSLAA